jgi:outer membrane protein insertion porin family
VAVACLAAAPAASAQDVIGQPIVAVVVEQEGLAVTDPLVHGLIETTVGEPLSMRDVRETILHLDNLRRFDDIQPFAEAVPGGVRIRYLLVPAHPIDRIEFTGTLGLAEGEVRRVVTERFGRAPTRGRLGELVEVLQRTYRDRGYPSATIASRVEETHAPDRATLFLDIQAGRRARIADLRVLQLDDDTGGPIADAPDIRIGDPYDATRVDETLRDWVDSLRARGYYEARASHGADIDAASGDAYLRVNVARGPRVEVAFAGDPLPADEREQLVPVRAEGSADEDLLEDARVAIEQYLRARGYRDAAAPYTRTETPGALTITFTITRGPRYVVDDVRITGNTALPADTLRELLAIETGEPYSRDALGTGVAAIQGVYRARGYTRASVETTEEIVGADRDRRLVVAVAIAEGPRTLVRDVTFEGNTVLTGAQLLALVPPAPGAVFSQADVISGRDRVELEYRDRGYAAVTVTPAVTPGEDETQADVRYTIVEGPQSVVDHIIIIGNERTDIETITRELQFREGEPLGYSALAESRARLAALGLFRRVDIQPLQPAIQARRDVLIQVEEADPTTLGFGGGVEGSYRLRADEQGGAPDERLELAPRGFFEIGRRNLWGSNRAVNLFTRVSLRSTDVLVDPGQAAAPGRTESNPGFNEFRIVGTFREPRLLGSPAGILVTGIVEQAIRTTFNFSRRIARAESGIGLPNAFSLTGRYSFERTKLFDEIFSEEEKPLIDVFFPQVRISKFAGSLLRDTRDEPLDASRGTFVIVDGDVAARAIGSEVGFVKTFIQTAWYRQLPTGRRTIVALSGRIGAARAFTREAPGAAPGEVALQELPASERFFAGGDTTVRGFSLDRLGEPDTISPSGFPLGGNGVIVLNGELRVNLTSLWQAVGFLDAGNVFRYASSIDVTDLRPAAGIGVRYSRFGTIRLDWGFNLRRRELTPGTLERGHVFHVSLGQAF